MRAGRFIGLGVACLLGLLVAGIWVVPGMLDWNRYRGSIAALVASAIGRPVRIGGDVTLHLLPQPILTASGIEVDDVGDGVVLAAHELRLRVALGPLLGGRVDARELELRGADLRLPWPPPPGALSRRPPAWLTGLQARVEESRLQVGNLVLSDIGASISTDPDTGTLSAAGSGASFGRSWRFTARLARPGGDGAAALDVSLDGLGKLKDTGGTFSGVLGADGALSGRVAARGPDLSQLMPGPAVAWRGDGRLTASAGLAVADELALEIGGSPARGAVALRVQPDARLDLAIAAGRLDLDAWIPVLMRSAQPGAQPTIPTGVDLSAEAATLAGGTLRRLRGAFDLDADGVSVRDATAVLPGDAQLSLSGRVPGRGRGTLFEGTGRLLASDFRTTLRWLEPFAPAVLGVLPTNALRTADLGAKLAVDPAQASFSDLRGTLDGAGLQGGLAVRIGARTGVSAGLSLDRLLLDPWLPDPAVLGDPARAYADFLAATSRAGFDVDLKLQLRTASWRGGEIGPLSLDGQNEAGRLTLRRLDATAFGVRATASGTLGEGGRMSEGRLELSTQDISPVRPLLPPDWALVQRLLRGPANLLLQLSGSPEALAMRATGELADIRLDAQPILNLPARRWAGPVTLHHPGAPRLSEVLGLPGTAAWLGDGSFSLITQAAMAPGRVELGNFELVAGSTRANGQLVLAERTVSGRVTAETLALPMVYPRSPDPLPLGALRDWRANLKLDAAEVLVGLTPAVQSLSTEVALGDGALRLQRVSGKLGGGELGGSIRLEGLSGTPRLTVAGEAKNVPVGGPLWGGTLDLLSGTLGAQVAISGEGYSPAALLATLSGTARVQVEGGAAAGFDLSAVAAALARTDRTGLTDAVRAALSAGTTPFANLDADVQARKGVLAIEAAATAPAGTASFTGTFDLLGGALEGQLALRPGNELPEVVTRLTGAAAEPTRTPELAGLARWLAERP